MTHIPEIDKKDNTGNSTKLFSSQIQMPFTRHGLKRQRSFPWKFPSFPLCLDEYYKPR